MEPIDTAEVHRLRRRCDFADARSLLEPHLAASAPSARALFLDGRLFFDAGDPVRALDRFDAAIAAAPDDPAAHAWRIAALHDLSRWTDADDAAVAATRAFPDDPAPWVAYGRLLTDRLRRPEAVAALDTAVRLAPGDPVAAEWRAYVVRAAYRYADAEEHLRDAVRRMPHEPDLLAELGCVLRDVGRYPEALAAFTDAAAMDPDRVDFPCLRAEALRVLGRHTDEEEVLRAAIERFPNAARPCAHLSDFLFDMRREDAALRMSEEAVRREPGRRIALRDRIATLVGMGRDDEAERAVRAAIEARPWDASLAVWLAVVLARMGRDDDALAACDRALEIDPRRIWAMQERVDALSALGRADDARAAAEEYARRYPGEPGLQWKLAQLRWLNNRDAQALSTYERVLELDPYDIGALRGRCSALRYLNRPADALRAAERAQTLRPYDTEFGDDRARCLWAGGEYADALAQLDDLLKADPYDEELLAQRVGWLRSLGRLVEAESRARDALELLPGSLPLIVARSQVQYERGDAEAAIVTLTEAIERLDSGHEPYLATYLFQPIVDAGRPAEGVAWAERIIAAHPDNENVFAWLILLLRLSRRYDEAESRAREFLARNPAATEVLVQLACAYEDVGRFTDALDRAEALLALAPDHLGNRTLKLRLLRQMHRFDDAEEDARAGIARYPHTTVFHGDLAQTLDRCGRHEEALARYESALRIDPRDIRAVRGRIRLLARLRRLDEATEEANAALAAHPDARPGLLHALATVHDAAHRYDDAVRCLDEVCACDPYDISAAVEKANVLRSARRFDEAERVLTPLAERYPDDQDVRAALGWTRRDQGRVAEARADFARLLADAASPAEKTAALHGLGWLDLDGRDPARARDRFRQALEARPTSYNARQGLAWALVRADDPGLLAEAEELCLAVLAQRPRDAEACVCLGVIEFRRGRHAQAEYWLRRSIEMDPYGGSHVDLGALYVQLGRHDEAHAQLDAALARDWYDAQAHIEAGNLRLVRISEAKGLDRDDGRADGGTAAEAARHFRQALIIDPASGAAAIGLALALAHGGDGGLAAAENVLRRSLRGPCDHPAWQLRLTLARLLIENGDATQRTQMYEDAVVEAQAAIELKPDAAEPYFVAGVAEYKRGQGGADLPLRGWHRRRARAYLRRYRTLDPADVEARRVLRLIEDDVRTARRSAYSSVTLSGISVVLIIALWTAFLVTDRVTPTMLMTLTPVMVGLVALGLVLPLLTRLKLPGGVEADLAASLSQISSGPPGMPDPSSASAGFGRGEIAVSPGPHGAVGRRE